ncbi:efflux transporter outer membrane subunit [Desulfobacter sp.]|uniref:efflux transporter outer membrane subunit n=1 Tax=Desulfobacter sp. TaxID=2294 RepID=UPI003D12E612
MNVNRILPLLAGLVLLNGCAAVGPDFKPPQVVPPAGLLESTEAGSHKSCVVPQELEILWWRLFNDNILNELQIRAQKGNLDYRMAAARVEQSRAQIGIVGAAGLPMVGVGGAYAREAVSANGLYGLLGVDDAPYNYYTAGFDAAWEIDLWGHTRRAREAAGAAMQADFFQKEWVKVAVAAEVARVYIQLRLAQTQLDITRENLDIAAHALKLAESRVKNGVATQFESAASSAQLSSVAALIPRLEEQRDALMNGLALLLGEAPKALNAILLPMERIPPVPEQVPMGLPSELARRRPDILQAEARLHEAVASIGAAKADFYPRINLVGGFGLESLDFDVVGDWASRTFTMGPKLYLPIFQGGRLKSRLALTQARQKEAAINFHLTVLRAWHEVDDALSAYAKVQERTQALTRAVEEYRRAYNVCLRRYEQGAADYLSVLTSQRLLLAGQMELADNTSRISINMVNLYKALGGGWAVKTHESAINTGGKQS